MSWRYTTTAGTQVTVWDDDTRRVTGWLVGHPETLNLDRAYTTQENADADARDAAAVTATTAMSNRDQLISQGTTAISSNQTYLGIASPTNAQVVAQVRALTQQMNKVIRLVIAKLDGTD